MTFVLLRNFAMRAACWGLAAVVLGLALGLGACTVQLQLSGPRVIQGDIAATSMGLAAFERWFEATPVASRPLASGGITFAHAAPNPPARRTPEITTLALAPRLEIAAGPARMGERLQASLDALVIAPALGPPALTLVAQTPPRLALEPPPRPAPRKPRGAAGLWIPRAKPVAGLDLVKPPGRAAT